MTEEASLANRIASWKLISSSSRTALAEGTTAPASATSIKTDINVTATRSDAASNRPRGSKRKNEEEYKIVPDPSFPTFKELRQPATRETKVKTYLAQTHMTQTLTMRNRWKYMFTTWNNGDIFQTKSLTPWPSTKPELPFSIFYPRYTGMAHLEKP